MDSKYRVTLEALEESVQVDLGDLVAVHDVPPAPDPDAFELTGHLPGNVRPYGA